jgi:hypothetical protein
MSNQPTPLSQASPEVVAASVAASLDRSIQNPVASHRRRELIADLEARISPLLTAGELRELHGQILTLKTADTPPPPRPPITMT